MKRRIKKKNDESEINITPMLDIVFIMLIFFIVTTSFVKEISIDVNRPTKSPIKEQKKSDVISVRISSQSRTSHATHGQTSLWSCELPVLEPDAI